MASASKIFTAHAVTDGSGDSLRFVPHGFAWGAFWFGPLWLLWRRHWYRAAVLVGVVGATEALLAWFLVSAFVGLEAQEWRRRALQRRGSAIVGYGYGSDEADVWARAAFGGRAAAERPAS